LPSPEPDIGATAKALADRIEALPRHDGRRLIAIAGAPASGKSLLSGVLATTLTHRGRTARVIPMDGFHLDNKVLTARGLLPRKGAPETFDAHGFIALIKRIKRGGEVIYPEFDRSRDLAIAGAAVLGADCDTAIIEGNYLLFDEPPWSELKPLWDLSVWIDTPMEVIRARCIQRWLDHGHSQQDAEKRAEGNDLRNAKRIAGAQLPADMVLRE